MRHRPMTALTRAQAKGSQAAARELARLRADQSMQIDVFRTIEDAGIWLMFQPMRGLYGAYMREGAGVGIIVNSNHPLSVRRFTAAHEYGHHVLGHGSVVDGENTILPVNKTPNFEEAAAQTFAANFLMPLQLVNTLLREMGLTTDFDDFTATQVYLLSLNLGSSYPATISQLLNLKKISFQKAQSLRIEQPRSLKANIGRGIRPAQSWADTWQVGAPDSGRTLYPKVDDLLFVELPETPSSGYLWSVAETTAIDLNTSKSHEGATGALLALEDSFFEGRAVGSVEQAGRVRNATYGSGGLRRLTFRALQPGELRLRIFKQRPWEKTAPLLTYELNLRIMRAGSGGTEQGLSIQQWVGLAEAA